MKKKSFDFESDTTKNEQAVTAALKRKRKPDPDTWPTRTQLQEPLPGQQSLFDTVTEPAAWRRKPTEKRTVRKQLVISPTARKNLQERAKMANMSANECVNQLTAAAIKNGLQIIRERKPETKSLRLIFVTTPTLEKAIENAATAQGVSLNEYICFVLENHERVKL